MGFNKRFLNKEVILRTEEKFLDDLFSADAFIMDEWSEKFMKLHEDGLDKLQIIGMLDDGEN